MECLSVSGPHDLKNVENTKELQKILGKLEKMRVSLQPVHDRRRAICSFYVLQEPCAMKRNDCSPRRVMP